MSSSVSSSCDTLILSLGLFAVLAIGGGWLYKNTHTGMPQEKGSSSAISHHDFSPASSEDLKKAIFSGSGNISGERRIKILDARPGSLWSEEHVIGSESLVPEDAERSFAPTAEDVSSDWIVLGDTKERAQILADVLADRGVPSDRIRLYDGTFSIWKSGTGLITAPGDPSSPADAAKVKLLSPSDANTTLKNGMPWKVVDVRSSRDFPLGHIPSAVNIPFADLERRRNELSLSNMLVYGGSDIESFRAGTLLFDLGIFSVATLSGSFDDWKNANLPVEK